MRLLAVAGSLFLGALFAPLVHSQPLGASGASTSGRCQFKDCYAVWKDNVLTVGNARFERSWVWLEGALRAASFRTKAPDQEWLVNARSAGSTNGVLSVAAATGRFGPVEAESLRLEILLPAQSAQVLKMRVFPETPGVLLRGELSPPGSAVPSQEPAAKAVGIETGLRGKTWLAEPGSEEFSLAPQHLRVIQVTFVDQTDSHNELVSEREWLLGPNEETLQLAGNLVCIENVLDESGLVLLKLAPLPHARSTQGRPDFLVTGRDRKVQAVSSDCPVITLAYQGGRVGRTVVLQRFQRQLRLPNPARDGVFLSNTWGDRSRDARINEAFILKEVEAGAALGVEVIQIDDGWQKGRTRNSASKGGVWGGWWAADPQFWQPDPARFPHGLKPVAQAARAKGVKLGLWFAPDSSQGATNWQRDADCMLALYRDLGVEYFKIDSLNTGEPLAYANAERLFHRVLQRSEGRVVFDLDVTAGLRPGYFGLPGIGPIFIENRYTDWRSYWPHQTLRALWQLSHYVDPLRLRVELLNKERNKDKYGADPLAPARYEADTLFAMTMVANPLGWFEVSNLPEESRVPIASLVKVWKRERQALQGGTLVPVGAAPDGMAWTGFASLPAVPGSGDVLLFRELNANARFTMDIGPLFQRVCRATPLAGRGEAQLNGGRLLVEIPAPLGFLWVRLDAGEGKAAQGGANKP